MTGQELKSLRLVRKFTVERLSTISGVSVGRIRLIEAGMSAKQEIIDRLIAALIPESPEVAQI